MRRSGSERLRESKGGGGGGLWRSGILKRKPLWKDKQKKKEERMVS